MYTSISRVASRVASAHRVALLVAVSFSIYGVIVVRTGANGPQKETKAKNGKVLSRTKNAPGPNLPDLAGLRNASSFQPQAPPSVPAQRQCLDCSERVVLSDDFFVARTEPRNRTGREGVDPLSQNYHWSLPLIGLPGRAGLDLNLSLSYNSLVWTRAGNAIAFDLDRGQPSPGFHVGPPAISRRYFNAFANAYSFLMTTSDGASVELRQRNSTNIYETVDGSHWLMEDKGVGGATVRTSAGAQLTFNWWRGQLQCTEIKDSNGNYLTMKYDQRGHLSRIVDTLGRAIDFNHDAGGNLLSISQVRDNQEYLWATFGYSDLQLNTNFSGVRIIGPTNGTMIPVLTQVGLKDGTSYQFEYTSSGQIWRTSNYAADTHLLSMTSYDLPKTAAEASSDCPRITAQRFSAESWNDGAEVVTGYQVASNDEWSQITLPNGTVIKQFYAAAGWEKGLVTRTETWSEGILQKWTTTSYVHDGDQLVALNPRPDELNIFDGEGNHRRTRIEYARFGLPKDVYEYSGDGVTVLRRTHTEFEFNPSYMTQNVIGLVTARLVYDGADNLLSKTTYEYDGSRLVDQIGATQHDDVNFGSSGLRTRGLESEVRRWDAKDPNNRSKSLAYPKQYYSTGSLAAAFDNRGRKTTLNYSDSFSDGTQRNAFAYATEIIDSESNRSAAQYDYATGAVVRFKDKSGNFYTQEHDSAGRLLKSTNEGTGAGTRWLFSDSGTLIVSFTKSESSAYEVETYRVVDGAGRVRAAANDLPNSRGGYSGSYIVYDAMGQAVQRTNPTEMSSSWKPAGDDASGWIWSAQRYDWKGRPTLTINSDGTSREAKYGGCGCAGGEVVTLVDEGGRSYKQSKDSLGRLAKVEELNRDGSVYATTEYTYDALDHMSSSNQSGQIRRWEYDGFERRSIEVTPEQGRTEYEYNGDGLLKAVTDARGAKRMFSYDSHDNLKGISYRALGQVIDTPSVSFGYNAQDRREWMQDGVGRIEYHYNERGQLKEESRKFNELPQSVYTLSYQYDAAGILEDVATSWGEKVAYKHDPRGRLTDITHNEVPVITDVEYRAWGAIKNLRYGNGLTLALEFDDRLRLIKRNIDGVQGAEYGYDDFGESTGRVTSARDLYDRTLDRSYQYDQVGRLQAAYTSQPARNLMGGSANAGQNTDGPYNQQYGYDVWGNLLEKTGANEQPYRATYKNNQIERDPLTGKKIEYDLAGNLTDDGRQQFSYDAAGHQRRAKSQALDLKQDYDGNGLRAKRLEGNIATYYVRSTVLGNQVVADLDAAGGVVRSYVYSGFELLAVKDKTGLAWIHADPVTKSKRATNKNGQVIGGIELDPWGNETTGTFETTTGSKNPRRFTTYERDDNNSDDAMHRRYNASRGRFDQPDPYRGSVNPSDPQSFNRYAYTKNDPVNHSDPSGLMPIDCGAWGFDDGNPAGWFCINYDPWGGYNPDPPPPPDMSSFQQQIDAAVADALTILSTDNPCSQFFGGSNPQNGSRDGTEVLQQLGAVLAPSNLGRNSTGIQMSNFGTVTNTQTSLEYRMPAAGSAKVNTFGPFFQGGRFGSFNALSRQGRALAILHELAHLIKTATLDEDNGSFPIYLIPEDGGDDSAVSNQNTATVEAACGDQLRALQ
jgi:RHS repeat-associated protein